MRALVVGNWKLYVSSLKEGRTLLRAIDKALPRQLKSKVVLAPDVSLAVALRASYGGKRISFATQSLGEASEGAHTGSISGSVLKESGIEYVIVGHSEERARGESDQVVERKVRAALNARLSPIICIGEESRDHDGLFFTRLGEMVQTALSRVDRGELKRVVIAYEPVWAIGAAAPPPPRVASEAIMYIRKILSSLFSRDEAERVRILYGGSVDAETARGFVTAGNADGLLVGRHSVFAKDFAAIVRACE
jgi:triosephosphate isomerase